jgi:hypothetical protein
MGAYILERQFFLSAVAREAATTELWEHFFKWSHASKVLGGRLELPSLAALVPKTNVYTNSTIPALWMHTQGL